MIRGWGWASGSLVLSGGLLIGIAACASGPDAPPASGGDVVAEALAEARAEGAGPEQVHALQAAEASGTVSLEAAREAARRTVSCMVDAGLQAEYSEQTLAGGLVVPGYLVASSDGDESDVQDAAIDSCVTRESLWINKVLQLQPTSVQQREDFANRQEGVLRACLEENGVQTDPEADGVDLANLASDAMRDGQGSFDCLHEAGIDAW